MWYVKIKVQINKRGYNRYFLILSKAKTVSAKQYEIGQPEQQHTGFTSIKNLKNSWEKNISKAFNITEWELCS